MRKEYETAVWKMAPKRSLSGRAQSSRLPAAMDKAGSKAAFSDNRRLIQRHLLRLHPLIQRAFMDLHGSLMAVSLNLTFLHG